MALLDLTEDCDLGKKFQTTYHLKYHFNQLIILFVWLGGLLVAQGTLDTLMVPGLGLNKPCSSEADRRRTQSNPRPCPHETTDTHNNLPALGA